MNWELIKSDKQNVSVKIQGLLSAGAKYVLVKCGEEFLAIRHNGDFVDDLRLANDFMADLRPNTVKRAIQNLLEKANAQPLHLAILLGIFSDED